jgi:hypothetical protein
MACGTILVTTSTGGGGTTSGTTGTTCVNGATHCSGTTLMTCNNGKWTATTPNSPQCGYKTGGGTTTSSGTTGGGTTGGGTTGGGTTGGGTTGGGTSPTCNGLYDSTGQFNVSCLFEPQNQNTLIALGVGAVVLFILLSRR